jgi:WD40 repeat protein
VSSEFLSQISVSLTCWILFFRIWRGFGQQTVRIANSVIDHQLFDDRVIKLDAYHCDDQYRIAVALNSGEILIWRLLKSDLVTMKSPRCSVDSEECASNNCQVLTRHKQPAIDVKFNQNGEKLVSCGEDCVSLTNLDNSFSCY